MLWKLQENVISESDLEMLTSFISTTRRFTQFVKVTELERAFSAWQGGSKCVFVNSGSSANLLLVNAAKQRYRWRDGDEVIVPALTWPTTVTPVMQSALQPVFCDVNLGDFSFDYDRLAALITPRTRAIFVVHVLGFPSDIPRIKEIIGGREIVILEDCCESQGATIDDIKVGNHGQGGTFSFYWGHHMTTIEGGMVCTSDEELHRLLRLKRSHGLARELPEEDQLRARELYPDIDFEFLFLTDGFNFRNTEFNAVIGLAQLPRLDEFIRIRNANYRRFVQACKRHPERLLVLEKEGMSSFVLPFVFTDRQCKAAFQALIRQEGIESRPLISGNLLRQPFLRQFGAAAEFPCADYLHTHAFYIGNNQFVDDRRLEGLEQLMDSFFGAQTTEIGRRGREDRSEELFAVAAAGGMR